jgi:hypothetical protein
MLWHLGVLNAPPMGEPGVGWSGPAGPVLLICAIVSPKSIVFSSWVGLIICRLVSLGSRKAICNRVSQISPVKIALEGQRFHEMVGFPVCVRLQRRA